MTAVAVNRRGIALTTAAHLVNDMYQGVVPALLPFLVAERHYSYAAVAGLTLAATVVSSVVQPAFGWLGDRRPRRWLIGGGMLLAAVGVGLVGFTDSYVLTWVAIAVSGLGIAAFHPEAARAARQAAGSSNQAMSLFALGGNGGYALGSLVATPIFLTLGVRGAPLLVVPAVVMAIVLFARLTTVLDGPTASPRPARLPTGTDDWRAFFKLTVVVVIRSILFLGVSSFIALFFIEELDTSDSLGGIALTTFLLAGAVGTFFGGWLADRSNRIVTLRTGFVLALPGLLGILLSPVWPLTLVFVVLTGIGLLMPFSVMVMLGQDYLPNRIGTASGVTVGLAMTVGGLFTPLLGALADQTSLPMAFTALVVLPPIAIALSIGMREAGQPQVGLEPSATSKPSAP